MRTKVKRKFTHKGKTKTISEWSEEYCIPYDVLKNRINLGWSSVRALTEPIRIKRLSVKKEVIQESEFDRCIKRAIWTFKKEKFRKIRHDFEIHIPSYLHARWLKVA